MSKINPKFEDWKIYLTKFIGGKMYSLDIRANNGEITCWMLKNLCINSYSNVYSIDTWINCAKCGDKIENEFTENVLKTGKTEQNIKMKSDINDALIKIKSMRFIIFDFIYINTQDYPGDVFTNIVISWEILNEEGIMIISNFKVNDDKEGFKIKTAIDTFISINKLQLEILDSEDYYIIKKLNQKYTHSPMIEYDNLYEEINNFKNKIVDDVVFDDIIDKDLEFDLKIIPEEKMKVNIPNINKDGISNYDLLFSIYGMKESFDTNKFYINLIKKYNLTSIIKLNYKKIVLNFMIDINKIKKYIQYNNKILINYNYNNNDDINLIVNNSIKKNIKIKDITINNIVFDNNNIYNNIINNKRYDIISYGVFIEFLVGSEEKYLRKNSINNLYILYELCAALNIQKLHGKLIISTSININIDLISECVFILKKYYNKVNITNRNIIVNISSSFYIVAEGFLGINKDDKNKINLLINNIYNNIGNNNNVKLLKNYDEKIINNIKIKINNFINQKIQNTTKIIILYDKIINFKKKNNNILNNNINLILFKIILNNIISNIL